MQETPQLWLASLQTLTHQAVTIAALGTLRCWVAWQTEDRPGGEPTKVPYGPDGNKARADTPATWGTRAEAEVMAARLSKPYGLGGIGIEFSPIDEVRSCGGVDLDSCRNRETGEIDRWATDIIDRFASYTEMSPSGTGIKIFYVYASTDLPRLRDAMGGGRKFGKQFKRGIGKHPPSIELHLGHRYFTLTEERLEGTPSELRPVATDTLLWLIQCAGPAFAQGDTKTPPFRKPGKAGTDGSRSAAAMRKGAQVQRDGGTFEDMCRVLAEDPETAGWCREKGQANGNRELRRIWDRSKVRIDSPDNGCIKINGQDLTEDGIALAFAEVHQDRLKYDHTCGAWFQWTGKSWRRDEVKLGYSWCRRICRQLAKEAGAEGKLLSTMARASTAAAVEKFAQSDPKLAVTSAIWDKDQFLLGTPTGTVDLRTGEMREPAPEDYITKLTAVGPAPVPECKLWLAFLHEATNGDAALIRFIRQWCGYSLTGDTREHALLFIHGPGGNGKSVLLSTIAGIMGAYARNAAMDTFVASANDRHSTDLAMLRGARMVTASETEEGRAWAETRIKALTGGDAVTARFMRRDNFEFRPEFKLTISGNHRPALKNVDDAARRRVNVMPFTHKPTVVDRQLEVKLRAEWPEILRWMIEGCLDWQKHGLVRPDVVVSATADYFSDQDSVAEWIEDRCIVGVTQSDTRAELFKSWKEFAEASGEKPGTSKWFSQTLTGLGYEKVKNTPGAHGKRGFKGIGLNRWAPAARTEPHEPGYG